MHMLYMYIQPNPSTGTEIKCRTPPPRGHHAGTRPPAQNNKATIQLVGVWAYCLGQVGPQRGPVVHIYVYI
jgi:hypothetical protein